MCTAITFLGEDFYFGRTLDDTVSRNEEGVITPRNYPFAFRHMGEMQNHYAIIGMACVGRSGNEPAGSPVGKANKWEIDRQNSGGKEPSPIGREYPLYYEAVNEKGLAMAGLNFVGNAFYQDFEGAEPGQEYVAQFELIPWILGQCATVEEARRRLERLTVTGDAFAPGLPPAQLHWLLADKKEAVTIEAVREGLRVYENLAGVLTNNPPFLEQMFQLNNYMHISPREPENLFCDRLPLKMYSRGMGALGLPGDLSSQSRFVRAVFTRMHAVAGSSEEENVSQFFHILGTVDQTKGCCQVGENDYEMTIYTSCCNTERGIYYYTTYGNRQITAVDMHRENLDGASLLRYPLIGGEQIRRQNENSCGDRRE
ncbi:MAG TPA: choloylglycine hydrolase [Candidatus Anaerobutyricum stercoris]|uniref:choloylglycine hydrolase n=1 Tax=Candidatus Anaerobutyricum stercoris TaxID=2838457 RepID=A0A9D2J7A9_9FIRM|nr:Choloylglycine hydrolase [Eubacteriaceae bacterium CHKCI004]HIZ38334.1 choloylglycine hydrolase [Candidatus Anaerobutyricum stercoris]